MPVFHSLQILSRNPFISLEEKMQLLHRARDMGLVFNRDEHMKFTKYDHALCGDMLR